MTSKWEQEGKGRERGGTWVGREMGGKVRMGKENGTEM